MKRFNSAVVVFLAIIMILSSCDGAFPVDKSGGSNGSGLSGDIVEDENSYWSIFKKNVMNLDFPANPNYAKMTDSEFKRFVSDMLSDPESAGASVDMYKGNFVYEEGPLMMMQYPDGEWYGSVPIGDEYFSCHLTNIWPDNVWTGILPGKPAFKFWAQHIEEYHTGEHEWYGIFVIPSGTDRNSVLNAYHRALVNTGWQMCTGDNDTYYAKNVYGHSSILLWYSVGSYFYLDVFIKDV